MRRRSIVLALTLTLAVAGCSAGSADWTPLPSGAEPPAKCARADASGVIEISANQLRFSAPCMVAPVGVAFVIRFTNNEAEQHDVAVYSNRSKSTQIFQGDTIGGPHVTKDYPIEALAAGEYYFDCIVHPADMNGALYVR
jgi:plastocyanin